MMSKPDDESFNIIYIMSHPGLIDPIEPNRFSFAMAKMSDDRTRRTQLLSKNNNRGKIMGKVAAKSRSVK